tara:strand:- start:9 stop:449 length:441 start_codon:yes stop_codon:yes gene_type:complete
MANPMGTPDDAARHFGTSRMLMHRMMTCGAFQTAFAKTLRELDQSFAMATMAERITSATSQALSKLEGIIESTADPDVIIASLETLRKYKGSGGETDPAMAATLIHIDARNQTINQMRDNILERAKAASPFPERPAQALDAADSSR